MYVNRAPDWVVIPMLKRRHTYLNSTRPAPFASFRIAQRVVTPAAYVLFYARKKPLYSGRSAAAPSQKVEKKEAKG